MTFSASFANPRRALRLRSFTAEPAEKDGEVRKENLQIEAAKVVKLHR